MKQASAPNDNHELLCNDLQPREPITVQPFQRQLDDAATGSHASLVGSTSGRACAALPQGDPQMEALLQEVQGQPLDVTQATSCEQSWQALTDSPADSCSPDLRQTPFWQPMLCKKACLDERAQSSEIQAKPAASLPQPLRDTQPASDAPELRAQETCAAHDYHLEGRSHEAAGAAQDGLSHDAAGGSEDMQGPSTPAGRPGMDRAKQDGGKQEQQPEMASLLQQDVASLKGQVRPPPWLRAQLRYSILGDLLCSSYRRTLILSISSVILFYDFATASPFLTTDLRLAQTDLRLAQNM